ncbi:ap2-like ethylene-responsive transcription factor at1g16060 [Phtheirospermum japonicum]|uniref:Ap2-like ethylene-responsive transcription factor at1g16060 n=1 Tax=Phtheirospermum japonicum TaxID=374723 RepID=A0A830DE68_9LAMI|nr:ap2-like ethylene-responsive transcription factor at1g16060 [Phtheirospermum japonicum]
MAKSSKQKNSLGATTTEGFDNKNQSSNISIIKKAKRTRKSIPRESPRRRSSIFRGVTRHRWTGRYEAHLWDKNSWNESQSKKGRQGAYDDEEAAARAYDLAALKYWGQDTILNFPLCSYQDELNEMEGLSKEEYISSLRRHHHNGRWEARIGRVFGNKYLYLGTYATQEEAATAYDMAAVKYRGLNAVTNFDLSRYAGWLEPLRDPPTTPMGNMDNSTVQDSSQEMGLTFLAHHPESPIVAEVAGSPSEPGPQRSSFPDDIQTSFEFQDSSSFAEEHDVIFGNYDSFVSSVFQCGLDA